MRLRAIYKLLVICAGLASVTVALLAFGFDVLKRADLSTVDARFSIRGPRAPSGDLIFVKIDTASFDHLNTKFPFPRKLHAHASTPDQGLPDLG